MLNAVPQWRGLTVLLGALLAGMVAYGLFSGNLYGYIVAGVLLVFAGLPALVLLIASASERRRDAAQRPDDADIGLDGHAASVPEDLAPERDTEADDRA
jgi:hypothetical protein